MQTAARTAKHTHHPRTRRAPRAAKQSARASTGRLGHYVTEDRRPREIVAIDGRGGSVLVVDRDALTLADRRLVAHIGPDEPASNAALICALYLAEGRSRRCRAVARADLELLPERDLPAEERDAQEGPSLETHAGLELTDGHGRVYDIRERDVPGPNHELRWVRMEGPLGRTVSLREVVGALESYEPARALTLVTIRDRDRGGSVAKLRAELARLDASPIVLNRGLREAVLRAIHVEDLSMSEIARRCGRIKRDARGNESGEASWLGRRIGLLPEAGVPQPTPWVHSDVLGLIARRGLALSPREVEL